MIELRPTSSTATNGQAVAEHRGGACSGRVKEWASPAGIKVAAEPAGTATNPTPTGIVATATPSGAVGDVQRKAGRRGFPHTGIVTTAALVGIVGRGGRGRAPPRGSDGTPVND